MANPQPDKFTRFSNELFEAYIRIARILSPYENVVWLCIFRKTYGYKQKEDWISLSQVEIMTGIRQPHVARTKKKLLLKNMIAKRNGGVGIQKDYELWIIPKQVYLNRYDIPKWALPKQVIKPTQTGNQDLPKQVSLPLPKQVDTKESIKDTLTKETITKDTYGEHVLMTKEEYNKLTERLGQYDTDKYIEKLDNYIGSKGKKYHSHYRTILVWADKDKPDLRSRPTQAQVNSMASMARERKNEEANI